MVSLIRLQFLIFFTYQVLSARFNFGVIDAVDHQIEQLEKKVEEEKQKLLHLRALSDSSGIARFRLPDGSDITINIVDEEIKDLPVEGVSIYLITDYHGDKKGFFVIDPKGRYAPRITTQQNLKLTFIPAFHVYMSSSIILSYDLFTNELESYFLHNFFSWRLYRLFEIKIDSKAWKDLELCLRDYTVDKIVFFLEQDWPGETIGFTTILQHINLLGKEEIFYDFFRKLGLNDTDNIYIVTPFHSELKNIINTSGIIPILILKYGEITYKSGTAQISGRVLDIQNNPLSEAEVQIHPYTTPILTTKLTDQNGNFNFQDLIDINYTITVVKQGYKRTWTQFQPTVALELKLTLKNANNPPKITSVGVNPKVISLNETATLTCTATDPDNEILTYQWFAEKGEIVGSGAKVIWKPPTQKGEYKIVVRVYDSDYRTDESAAFIKVSPNNLPTIQNFYAYPKFIAPGSTTTITCIASDIDNDLLTYHWFCSSGNFIDGTGSQVKWQAPKSTGTYLIISTVMDHKGAKITTSTFITVDYWTIEIVDYKGNVGKNPAIAVDSNDNPIISYYDVTNGNLKIAKKIGDNWIIDVIDTSTGVGFHNSISIDNQNNIHISYYNKTSDKLCYAKYTGYKWVIKRDIDAGGEFNSIIHDNLGRIYIAYYVKSSSALKCIHGDGVNWTSVIIDTLTVGGCSLVVDQNNNPRIAYYDQKNGDLKLAIFSGGIWSTGTIDASGNVGLNPSYKLDKAGINMITYIDVDNQTIKLATFTTIGEITIKPVISGVGSTYHSLALVLLRDEIPFVVYYSSVTKDICCAQGPDWKAKIIESEGDIGENLSAIVDSKGLVHIAYYDPTNEILKYAKQNP